MSDAAAPEVVVDEPPRERALKALDTTAKVADALGRKQPFVTPSRSDVDELCFNVCWNNAECLNSVHDE